MEKKSSDSRKKSTQTKEPQTQDLPEQKEPKKVNVNPILLRDIFYYLEGINSNGNTVITTSHRSNLLQAIEYFSSEF